jgi:membrane protease YdiL (CAAX protease family)
MGDVIPFVFVLYVFLLVPRGALRSRRRLRAAAAPGASGGHPALPSRTHILLGTLFTLVVLFVVSMATARVLHADLFFLPPLGAREWAAAGAVLGLALLARSVSQALRPEAERRARAHGPLVPHSRQEWLLFLVCALAAGVAEEAAYRGVAVWVLSDWLGHPWPAVLLSAAAFTAAHAVQGRQSMLVVLCLALLLHALVWFTDTLVLAMLVHAVYDVLAGTLARRSALRAPAGATPGSVGAPGAVGSPGAVGAPGGRGYAGTARDEPTT